jgi:hypothetical protein
MSSERDADWDEAEREALAGLEDQVESMRRRHAGDPRLDVLHAARLDVLPGEWQAEVDAHLANSSWSRALVDGVVADTVRAAADEDQLDAIAEARLLARITRDARPTPAAAPRRWPQALPLWIGAAAVATILTVLAVRSTRVTAPATSSIAQREGAGSPEVTPGVKPRGNELKPATQGSTDAPATDKPLAQAAAPFVLAFDKPEVRLSAAALVWRGDSATAGAAYLADLKEGLDAYRASDYARADAALAALRPRYPTVVEPPFYQGASRLLAGDAAGAIEPLTEAARVADDAFASEVTLLLAAAEQRTGRIEAARARLRRGCTPADPRTSRVCASLAQFDRAVPAPLAKP